MAASSAWARLQWGRNFIVAEIFKTSLVQYQQAHASMGPQLYRCGNSGLYTIFSKERHASMGPQLYRCGNGTLGPIIGSDYD